MANEKIGFCGVEQTHDIHMWEKDYGGVGLVELVCYGFNRTCALHPQYRGKRPAPNEREAFL